MSRPGFESRPLSLSPLLFPKSPIPSSNIDNGGFCGGNWVILVCALTIIFDCCGRNRSLRLFKGNHPYLKRKKYFTGDSSFISQTLNKQAFKTSLAVPIICKQVNRVSICVMAFIKPFAIMKRPLVLTCFQLFSRFLF